ncbi:hypothetical protein O3M35_001714 [Rhynocoris fuscipes]|uniref:Methylosome protein 50 n=1 Tax=Rhynocoris fuscipes TaxID=488301 RepID=A0AAW1CSJ0_9HEMI
MTLTMEGNDQERIPEDGDCKPYNFSVVPFQLEQHFEFIEISEDGYLLLGSSNLVLNYWNGSIWYFKDADLAPEKEHSLTGHGRDCGIACGKFLESKDKIIVGDDSGALTIYHATTFENDTVHLIPQMISTHHDSSITSLSVTSSRTQTISGGNDLAINVWDNESLVSEFKYSPAHTRTVTDVVACKEENSIFLFASSSLDGSALLWDTRMNKAASCIKEGIGCGLTALSWKNNNEIAIGLQSGKVAITDVRTNCDIAEETVMDCAIHKILFDDKNLLAVCGDSTSVKVWDSNSKNIVYSDERHTGFVRGLAWHPKSHKLYSCGFDKKVFSHQINTYES